MIKKNIYTRITESIVTAYHNNNLDTAMEDGHEMENMGKKIVAIITADPDQDLDWGSEYEPFGATELSADDEVECCEHEGISHDTCPSCGTDVNGYIVSDCEDDDENDDMEDIMIGGSGVEYEGDEYDDMDIKDILVDILEELKGEDSDEEGVFETSDENSMFGDSEDEDGDDYEDEDDDDEDVESILTVNADESDDEDDSEEEDNEEIEEIEDIDGMLECPEGNC